MIENFTPNYIIRDIVVNNNIPDKNQSGYYFAETLEEAYHLFLNVQHSISSYYSGKDDSTYVISDVVLEQDFYNHLLTDGILETKLVVINDEGTFDVILSIRDMNKVSDFPNYN